MKPCPRCNGKGWTYYRGYKCWVCRGAKKVEENVYLCEGVCKVTQVDHVKGGWHYRTFHRKCQRVATETVGGRRYCWQHSPADGYAKRVRWLGSKGYKHTIRSSSPALRRAWSRQQQAIRAAVDKTGKRAKTS